MELGGVKGECESVHQKMGCDPMYEIESEMNIL